MGDGVHTPGPAPPWVQGFRAGAGHTFPFSQIPKAPVMLQGSRLCGLTWRTGHTCLPLLSPTDLQGCGEGGGTGTYRSQGGEVMGDSVIGPSGSPCPIMSPSPHTCT